ncbi:hypothetical protein DIPPA_31624 [Diplonema papillatum]|nr:hypothetical protein DIPPA_31624 [Diplonema papillatum]
MDAASVLDVEDADAQACDMADDLAAKFAHLVPRFACIIDLLSQSAAAPPQPKVLLLTRTDVLIAAASGGVDRRLRLADLTRLTLLHGPAHLGPQGTATRQQMLLKTVDGAADVLVSFTPDVRNAGMADPGEAFARVAARLRAVARPGEPPLRVSRGETTANQPLLTPHSGRGRGGGSPATEPSLASGGGGNHAEHLVTNAAKPASEVRRTSAASLASGGGGNHAEHTATNAEKPASEVRRTSAASLASGGGGNHAEHTATNAEKPASEVRRTSAASLASGGGGNHAEHTATNAEKPASVEVRRSSAANAATHDQSGATSRNTSFASKAASERGGREGKADASKTGKPSSEVRRGSANGAPRGNTSFASKAASERGGREGEMGASKAAADAAEHDRNGTTSRNTSFASKAASERGAAGPASDAGSTKKARDNASVSSKEASERGGREGKAETSKVIHDSNGTASRNTSFASKVASDRGGREGKTEASKTAKFSSSSAADAAAHDRKGTTSRNTSFASKAASERGGWDTASPLLPGPASDAGSTKKARDNASVSSKPASEKRGASHNTSFASKTPKRQVNAEDASEAGDASSHSIDVSPASMPAGAAPRNAERESASNNTSFASKTPKKQVNGAEDASEAGDVRSIRSHSIDASFASMPAGAALRKSEREPASNNTSFASKTPKKQVNGAEDASEAGDVRSIRSHSIDASFASMPAGAALRKSEREPASNNTSFASKTPKKQVNGAEDASEADDVRSIRSHSIDASFTSMPAGAALRNAEREPASNNTSFASKNPKKQVNGAEAASGAGDARSIRSHSIDVSPASMPAGAALRNAEREPASNNTSFASKNPKKQINGAEDASGAGDARSIRSHSINASFASMPAGAALRNAEREPASNNTSFASKTPKKQVNGAEEASGAGDARSIRSHSIDASFASMPAGHRAHGERSNRSPTDAASSFRDSDEDTQSNRTPGERRKRSATVRQSPEHASRKEHPLRHNREGWRENGRGHGPTAEPDEAGTAGSAAGGTASERSALEGGGNEDGGSRKKRGTASERSALEGGGNEDGGSRTKHGAANERSASGGCGSDGGGSRKKHGTASGRSALEGGGNEDGGSTKMRGTASERSALGGCSSDGGGSRKKHEREEAVRRAAEQAEREDEEAMARWSSARGWSDHQRQEAPSRDGERDPGTGSGGAWGKRGAAVSDRAASFQSYSECETASSARRRRRRDEEEEEAGKASGGASGKHETAVSDQVSYSEYTAPSSARRRRREGETEGSRGASAKQDAAVSDQASYTAPSSARRRRREEETVGSRGASAKQDAAVSDQASYSEYTAPSSARRRRPRDGETDPGTGSREPRGKRGAAVSDRQPPIESGSSALVSESCPSSYGDDTSEIGSFESLQRRRHGEPTPDTPATFYQYNFNNVVPTPSPSPRSARSPRTFPPLAHPIQEAPRPTPTDWCPAPRSPMHHTLQTATQRLPTCENLIHDADSHRPPRNHPGRAHRSHPVHDERTLTRAEHPRHAAPGHLQTREQYARLTGSAHPAQESRRHGDHHAPAQHRPGGCSPVRTMPTPAAYDGQGAQQAARPESYDTWGRGDGTPQGVHTQSTPPQATRPEGYAQVSTPDPWGRDDHIQQGVHSQSTLPAHHQATRPEGYAQVTTPDPWGRDDHIQQGVHSQSTLPAHHQATRPEGYAQVTTPDTWRRDDHIQQGVHSQSTLPAHHQATRPEGYAQVTTPDTWRRDDHIQQGVHSQSTLPAHYQATRPEGYAQVSTPDTRGRDDHIQQGVHTQSSRPIHHQATRPEGFAQAAALPRAATADAWGRDGHSPQGVHTQGPRAYHEAAQPSPVRSDRRVGPAAAGSQSGSGAPQRSSNGTPLHQNATAHRATRAETAESPTTSHAVSGRDPGAKRSMGDQGAGNGVQPQSETGTAGSDHAARGSRPVLPQEFGAGSSAPAARAGTAVSDQGVQGGQPGSYPPPAAAGAEVSDQGLQAITRALLRGPGTGGYPPPAEAGAAVSDQLPLGLSRALPRDGSPELVESIAWQLDNIAHTLSQQSLQLRRACMQTTAHQQATFPPATDVEDPESGPLNLAAIFFEMREGGRPYYWHVSSDTVSWDPPPPKACVLPHNELVVRAVARVAASMKRSKP